MKGDVSTIARTYFFNLCSLASISRLLTNTATDTRLSAFALTRIDYCSSLLFASTYDVTFRLLRMQNYAAGVIVCTLRSANITTHIKSFYWLHIEVRTTDHIACSGYHHTIMSLICCWKRHHATEKLPAADKTFVNWPKNSNPILGDRTLYCFSYITLFVQMSGVPSYVIIYNSIKDTFVQFSKTELFCCFHCTHVHVLKKLWIF